METVENLMLVISQLTLTLNFINHSLERLNKEKTKIELCLSKTKTTLDSLSETQADNMMDASDSDDDDVIFTGECSVRHPGHCCHPSPKQASSDVNDYDDDLPDLEAQPPSSESLSVSMFQHEEFLM